LLKAVAWPISALCGPPRIEARTPGGPTAAALFIKARHLRPPTAESRYELAASVARFGRGRTIVFVAGLLLSSAG
jgi:hypothetical protein